MKNMAATALVRECAIDLHKVRKILGQTRSTAESVRYLTDYAVIRACGCIEVSFKTIIADFCTTGQVPAQASRFIDKMFRESSQNPSIHNIVKSLEKFDETWAKDFETGFKAHPRHSAIKGSIKSLVNCRNTFAHGSQQNTTFSSIVAYFKDACVLVALLDKIIR